MSTVSPAVDADPALNDALHAALASAADESGDAVRWAARSMNMLGLGSPESMAGVLPAVAARLFDSAVPFDRRCALANALASASAGASAGLRSALVERLLEGDDDNRAVAAHALAAARSIGAVPALVRLAHDVRVAGHARAAALHALVAIGDASVVNDVAALAQDDDAAVRCAAVVALRALDVRENGSKRRAKLFVTAAADEDLDVRCAALTALLVVGGAPACTAARRALADPAGAVRALAVVVLGRHGSPRDLSVVSGHHDDADARVRRAVRAAERCRAL